MNKTIYKYPIKVTDGQNISLPIGAEILTIQVQNEIEVFMWALVDPKVDSEIRHIEIFGTGNPVGYDAGVSRKYISTFQLKGGSLVFHVFEYTGV